MLANHVFWRLMPFYTHFDSCSCCNHQCCGFLLLPFIMMQRNRQSEFDVSRIRPRVGGLPHLETSYMAKFDPGWEGYPVWQTGLPALVGHPTYHVNVTKLKWENVWTGGLPHLSRLPHLPGLPQLHVNRPLLNANRPTINEGPCFNLCLELMKSSWRHF